MSEGAFTNPYPPPAPPKRKKPSHGFINLTANEPAQPPRGVSVHWRDICGLQDVDYRDMGKPQRATLVERRAGQAVRVSEAREDILEAIKEAKEAE